MTLSESGLGMYYVRPYFALFSIYDSDVTQLLIAIWNEQLDF